MPDLMAYKLKCNIFDFENLRILALGEFIEAKNTKFSSIDKFMSSDLFYIIFFLYNNFTLHG